jgi:hypothetical protein
MFYFKPLGPLVASAALLSACGGGKPPSLPYTLTGPASAANLRHVAPNAATPSVVGGVVLPDGSVKHGTGFKVGHVRAGLYVVAFDKDVFPTGCATMVVSPATGTSKHFIANARLKITCSNPKPEFYVSLINAATGEDEDGEFGFVAVGV